MNNKTLIFEYANRKKRIFVFLPVVIIIFFIEVGLMFIPIVQKTPILRGTIFTIGCAAILFFGYRFFSNFSTSDKFIQNGKFSFKEDKVVLRYNNLDIDIEYSQIESIKGVVKSELGIRYAQIVLYLKDKRKFKFNSVDTLKYNFKETEYFPIVKEFYLRNSEINFRNIKDYGKIK